jgi:hypothetical protein
MFSTMIETTLKHNVKNDGITNFNNMSRRQSIIEGNYKTSVLVNLKFELGPENMKKKNTSLTQFVNIIAST